jgi:hypothetical protein
MKIIGQYYLADVYGAGTFGDCDYNTSQNCSTTSGGGTSTTTSGSGLANTGIAVLSIISLACLIIVAAIIVRVVRRRSKDQPSETVASHKQ